MSRIVCSWCKAPLVLKDDILVCGNTDCPACDEKYLHEALIRTRKALGIAQSALVKLANDAYDMDEHIYIDKILNQIERITKGGDNE